MDGAHQQQHGLYPLYELRPHEVSRNHDSPLNDHAAAAAAATKLVSTGAADDLEDPPDADIVPPRVPVINHRPTISYRQIRPSDLQVLQEIHQALFPIRYEVEFFLNVIHGRGIISWAAVDTSRSDAHCDELIGFVTARVITPSEGEELDMLGHEISQSDETLIYILTLGVIEPYRNSGIASALLWEVVEHATRTPRCEALYLHVIAYNEAAILFYRKNRFQCVRRLPNFYVIDGRSHDALLHVFYLNGSSTQITAAASPCATTAIYSLKVAFAHVREFLTTVFTKLF